MGDFNTWVKEIKKQLAIIDGEFDSINSEMNGSIAKLKTFRDGTNTIYTNLKANSKASSQYFSSNESLRFSLSTLAFIGHDGEIIIDLAYFLKRSGLDLHRIIPNDINHEEIKVSQNGIARLVDLSDQCNTVNSGYLGIVIPLKITIWGQEKLIDLSTTIFLNHEDYESKNLYMQLGHNTTYCPENALDLFNGLKFLNITQPLIESRLINFGYNMGNIEIGSRPIILYGADINKSLLRIYISFGLKGKRKLPLLSGPISGFDVIIKLGNEFIHNAVASEISRLGLSISKEPVYNNPTSFSLAIQYTYRDSIKIGCVTIGYKIVAEADINVMLSISGRNRIVMKVGQLTEPKIVEVTSSEIPILSLGIKVINLFLSRFKIALDFTQTYTIEQNQTSMNLELTPQFLILKLKM